MHCICFNYLKLMNSILTNSLKWILLGQLICTPDDVTGDVAWRQFYGKTNAFDCKSSSLVALFQKLVSQTGWCWGASERHFLGAKDLLWKSCDISKPSFSSFLELQFINLLKFRYRNSSALSDILNWPRNIAVLIRA